ncbi:Thiamine monophosphate synthase [Candidatus Defluviicoccus seviourii]|uniref:Thiamine monophosphate synthase n=2 Tax=root TaxID=1 RepID=A0A564WC70_9PROT|nr:Thiamine monophosphate synthase [uncultured Defluviicoccus sp.]VUX46072.1 Thiamine monophosphate synthase [Candidatus Defluviicoccus seviourii]
MRPLKCARSAGTLPARLLMTDAARVAEPATDIARLKPGDAVIVRDYSRLERAAHARALKRLCRQRRLLLLVAGDAQLARAIGADGLHLPEGQVAAPGWRRFKRSGWLVTAAAHSGAAIARAFTHGADAVLVSPVFPTASHPRGRALGVCRFARLARASRLPVYALGGISAATLRQLSGLPIAGIAGISGVAGIRLPRRNPRRNPMRR